MRCNDRWETIAVEVRQERGDASMLVRLAVDSEGRWWRDGQELPALRGCVDVDLGISPSTNTLPIRRLALPVGAAQSIDAAWIRFPDLVIQVLPQRYTRLQERLYRYESGGAFSARLSVDEHGLVIDYDRCWERIAPRIQ